MALVLRLEDPYAAGGGAEAELRLDRRGAIIGRSPTVDWTLPDPEKIISSRHCEIDFRGGAYLLIDTSTNGTTVNDRALMGPHVLADGDRVAIGRYRLHILIDAPASSATPPPTTARDGWHGWSDQESASGGIDLADWDRAPSVAEISGRGALSGQWAPPLPTAPAPASDRPVQWGGWNTPTPPPEAPSGWASDPVAPVPPSAADLWGELASSNVVDWARGGFGVADPLPPLQAPHSAQPLAPTDLAAQGPPAAAAPSVGAVDGGLAAAVARAIGVPRGDLPDDGALAEGIGRLLRRLVAGLVVMLEARARAKAQMGAVSTSLQFDGNNPLKFARTPEQALVQLLRQPERGFMPADRAVEDAFRDLQAHQVATLKAMQGALKATLERFAPHAIQARAERKGLLARIMPGAREAALWRAYEKEFSGVAQGSDEAFMDVFAKEFRRAYDESARSPR